MVPESPGDRPPLLEVRSCAAGVRMAAGPGGRPVIRGHAAVFGVRSQEMRTAKGRRFVEQVRPGAFRRALADPGSDVRALFNHSADRLLGRRSAGTLRVWEDGHGLGYEIDPPDTSFARDLAESIRRRDVSGSSFSFATLADDWSEGEGGVAVRSLVEVRVHDVGPTVDALKVWEAQRRH